MIRGKGEVEGEAGLNRRPKIKEAVEREASEGLATKVSKEDDIVAKQVGVVSGDDGECWCGKVFLGGKVVSMCTIRNRISNFQKIPRLLIICNACHPFFNIILVI